MKFHIFLLCLTLVKVCCSLEVTKLDSHTSADKDPSDHDEVKHDNSLDSDKSYFKDLDDEVFGSSKSFDPSKTDDTEDNGRLFTYLTGANGTYGVTIGTGYLQLAAGGGIVLLSILGIGLLIAAIGSGVAFFYGNEDYYKYDNADYDSAYADFSSYAGKTDNVLRPVLSALSKVNHKYKADQQKQGSELYYKRKRAAKENK